jgi:hypothetical protein
MQLAHRRRDEEPIMLVKQIGRTQDLESRVVLPLEVLAAYVAGSVHVKLHVRIVLQHKKNFSIKLYLKLKLKLKQ